MACANLHDKANGTRLSRLLVDKGTEAMRQTFDNIHPPARLAAVLKAKVTQLQKLRYKVINNLQWDALYPASGNPSSKNFDVTLLTILLRNICGLANPATGWGTMPPDADISVEANIVRIKLFRNQVYAHVTKTEVDDARFEYLWQQISQALVNLGIPQSEVDELKSCSLSLEEETYVQQLRDWKLSDDSCKEILDGMNREVHGLKYVALETQQAVKETQSLLADLRRESGVTQTKGNGNEEILLKLAKYNFNGNVRSLVKSFQQGTREWLFQRLDDWFADQESRVMILTAGPGVGKSVFAGKVCQVYEEKEKLAACHFCKFNDSNLRNPRRMLESLASHMCNSITGFKEKLLEQLKRPHDIHCLEDAFRVYLNDPIQNLEPGGGPMLIVIDGLDESEADGKNELLELIAEEFSKLPEWLKILVTSRPEIPVKKKLSHLKPLEILPGHEDNEADLQRYFNVCLPDLSLNEEINRLLVRKCQGSFLFAFHVQSELRELVDIQDMSVKEIESFLPQGVGSVYQKYFRRLESELKVLNAQFDFRQLLEVLVSARGPLPLSFLSALLKLPRGSHLMKEALRKVNESLSSLLLVYGDLVTVFHKSVVDWLTANGYEEHQYAVDGRTGAKYLWETCKKEYEEVKERDPDVSLTNAMKYALDHGCSHLADDNLNRSPPTDFEWLVDPCIVHVIITVYPKKVDNLHASWKTSLEKSNCGNPELQRKMLWHFLMYKFSRAEFPEYLQDRINDSPSEITSQAEKSAAKSILNNSVWCEKLNSFREENTEHFLAGTLLESNISCIGISPNQEYCAAGREDGMITFLELPNLREIGTYPTGLKCPVPCCTFSPDNSFLLYGQLDYGFDVKTQNKSSYFAQCNHRFSGCSFSPSGTRLATADGSESVRLWDVETQSLLGLFRAGDSVNSCAYSACGLFLIGKEGKVVHRGPFDTSKNVQVKCIWSTITMERVDRRHPLVSRPKESQCFRSWTDFCSDETSVYMLGTEVVLSTTTGRTGQTVEVYALPQAVPVRRLYASRYPTYSVVKSNYLLEYGAHSWHVVDHCGYNELAVRLFSRFDYRFGGRLLFPLSFANDTTFLVQRETQLLTFKTPSEQPKVQQSVVTCSFSPDGSRLASCTEDKLLSIWDINTGKVLKKFRLFSKSVACWWSKGYFWRFHIANGKPILSRFPVNQQLKIKASEYEDHLVGCKAVRCFTFAEGVLVLGCKDGAVCALNVTDEKFKPVTMLVTEHSVDCAAVIPDGSGILMAGRKGYEIWRTDKNRHQSHRFSFDKDWLMWRTETCSIASNGELGLIISMGGSDGELCDIKCHVINMYSGSVVRCFSIDFRISYFVRYKWLNHVRICTGSSYVVVTDGINSQLNIINFESGELVGCMENPTGKRYKYESNLVFHRQQNVLAVPNHCGYIDFFKIHVPQ